MNRSSLSGPAIWADKLAMILWFIVTLFAGAMSLGAPPTNPGFLTAWIELTAITVLPLWVFLRLVDWLFNGPARRRGQITVRPL